MLFTEKKLPVRLVAWAVSFCVLAVVCVAWSILPKLNDSPVFRVELFAAAGFAMLGTLFFFPKVSEKKGTRLIFLAAVFLRLLLWPAPVSDDVHRYAWEGGLVLAGENPYEATHSDPGGQKRIVSDFQAQNWFRMNHRDRPTAYPPGAQWILAATVWVSESLRSFKVLALFGDLLTLALLLRLLRKNASPVRWAALYACNPVVLVAFAAEAHFDSLMVAAILATILAAEGKSPTVWIWLGLAIQIKLVCIVLVPLLLVGGSPWRDRPGHNALLRTSWLILPILILPSLPFAAALPKWWQGVSEFAKTGAFNAPLHTALATFDLYPETVSLIRLMIFSAVALGILIARWRGLPLIPACLWMIGALLACSPIVHFWYLTWLLPLVALRPSFAWTAVSISMAGYFLAWETEFAEGWWGFRHGTAALIWVPWVLAGLAQNRFFFSRLRAARLPVDPPELAIVLPILKPGPEVDAVVKKLQAGRPEEIVTVAAVCNRQAKHPIPAQKIANLLYLTAPRGRGNQIAAGIAATTSPWILIAHADAWPPPVFLTELRHAIRLHPETALFVFGQRFDRTGPGTLLVEALNEMRVLFGGVAFGDQIMVVRRSALEKCGGFPAQPLMEDVEASLRMAAVGPVQYLGKEWTVSSQKWQSRYRVRFFLVIKLVATYQLARLRSPAHAAALSEKMYREYYPSEGR